MALDSHALLSIVSRLQPLLDQEETSDLRRLKTKCYNELDDIFWAHVCEAMTASIRDDGDGFDLPRTDRSLINSGLLSEDVLQDPPENFTATVFNESLVATLPPLFHLSDWLQHRAQESVLFKFNEYMSTRERDTEADLFDGEDIRNLREVRDGLYTHAGDLFTNLPGITSQATQLVASGKLDEQIDMLQGLKLIQPDDTRISQLEKLQGIRKRFLQLASMRAEGRQSRILEGLTKLHLKMAELIQLQAEAVTTQEKKERDEEWVAIAKDEFKTFFKKEIPMVRKLFNLGTADAGIRGVHAVMYSTDARVPTERVQEILDMIGEYDPYLPGQPDIVLAPYRGNGFYEWDHNAIFVPLVCTHPVDESIVHAIATYRLLEDSLSNKYKIINPYKERFGTREFRSRFVRDYTAWILGVGRGLRGAMSDESYQFFKRNIGPNPEVGIFPREIMAMPRDEVNDEIRELRKMLARNGELHEERIRLTAMLWSSGRVQLAFENLQLLYKSMPANGKVALAYGMVCLRLGFREESKTILKRCVENSPQSLWQVYANEMLNQL